MVEGLTDLSITTRELETLQQHFVSVATPKINSYLRIHMKEPPLVIKYDEGNTACTEIIDGDRTIVLRPIRYFKREKGFEFPPDFAIHEETHIAEDHFLGLNRDRDTLTATFLHEGFAEYLAFDDPAGMYEALDMTKPEGSYERLRKFIKEKGDYGTELKSFLSLDKLYSTIQPDLKKEDLSAEKAAKADARYWVGSTLVRFIVEKKD